MQSKLDYSDCVLTKLLRLEEPIVEAHFHRLRFRLLLTLPVCVTVKMSDVGDFRQSFELLPDHACYPPDSVVLSRLPRLKKYRCVWKPSK